MTDPSDHEHGEQQPPPPPHDLQLQIDGDAVSQRTQSQRTHSQRTHSLRALHVEGELQDDRLSDGHAAVSVHLTPRHSSTSGYFPTDVLPHVTLVDDPRDTEPTAPNKRGHGTSGGSVGYVQLEPLDRRHRALDVVQDTLATGLHRLHRATRSALSMAPPRGTPPSASASATTTTTPSAATSLSFTAIPTRVAKASTAALGFYTQNLRTLQLELLCGVAATLLQIPETVAFSYVANLDPLMGLYATGFLGLVVGLFGGVPATVAGAAGAVAVVMPTLTGNDGSLADLSYAARVDHLFVAVFLAGVLELVFGLLDLSRFFSMIPRTAHIGFLNGLALVMLLSQKTTFEVCAPGFTTLRFGECERDGHLAWMDASDMTTWATLFTVLLTMAVMHFFPRVPKIGHLIPPTLVVAVIAVGFEFGINRPLLGWDVRTIGDTSPLSGGLPSFHVPSFGDVNNWGAVLSVAFSIAAIGIFESVMTLQAVVDLTQSRLTRAACRKECVAQGVGNLLCGVFGAMGGCSMIGQSTGNVLNGARHRLSTVMAGIVTFMIVLFASPVIELVPVACLTGILLIIIIHTFYWPSLQLVFRVKVPDAVTIILVTALAVIFNLAVAVIAGVVWQSLVNGWTSGSQIFAYTTTERVRVVALAPSSMDCNGEGDAGAATDDPSVVEKEALACVFHVRGTLLFSSVVPFRMLFDIEHAPSVVVVDLHDCHVADFSGVAVLKELAASFREQGKTMVVRHLDAHAADLVLRHDVGWELVDEIYRPAVTAATASVLPTHQRQHSRSASTELDRAEAATTSAHDGVPSTPAAHYHAFHTD